MSIVNIFFDLINKSLTKIKNSFNHLFSYAKNLFNKIMPFNQSEAQFDSDLIVAKTEAFIPPINIPSISLFINKMFKIDMNDLYEKINRGNKLARKEFFKNMIQQNDTKPISGLIESVSNVEKVQFFNFSYTTPLIDAAASGKLNKVRELIKAGADVTTTDTLHARTPLQWAFMYNHFDVCECLLDAMSAEQIDFQINYQSSRFPNLNAYIQTYHIEKLQCELLAIYPKNTNFSPFYALPFELLVGIFSLNYPTLTSDQILQNINLIFNKVYGTNEPVLCEAVPEPVVFSIVSSTAIPVENQNLEKLNSDCDKAKTILNTRIN
jgi:hypothetical protein